MEAAGIVSQAGTITMSLSWEAEQDARTPRRLTVSMKCATSESDTGSIYYYHPEPETLQE